MKLSYFDLISPDPVEIQRVGSIVSPKLKDISKISYDIYQLFLSLIMLTPTKYYEITDQTSIYETMSDTKKAELNIYQLIIADESLRDTINKALNFFMLETVIFNTEHNVFFTYNGTKDEQEQLIPSGIITSETYSSICNLILQRNYVFLKNEDITKVKSKKALEIMKKLERGRKKLNEANKKSDSNMELGNMISSVANKHPTLNIISIWDITIYQLWDAFQRITSNAIFDIHARTVSQYGDKDNQFKINDWYKNIETNN